MGQIEISIGFSQTFFFFSFSFQRGDNSEMKLRLFLSHCVVVFLGKRSAFYTFNPESRIFQFLKADDH